VPLSPRRVQVVLILTLIASLMSAFSALVNWIQAENIRDAQAEELVLIDELHRVEARIDANTADVAAFVVQLREQQARGPSPATLRLYALVEDIARAHGVEVPNPPPSSGAPGPTTTTTTTPG
jgi:hypothetical protein